MNLAERAAILGCTMREVVELARLDPRIVDDVALKWAGATHTRAWLAAGRPIADLAHLVFAGTPSFRRRLAETVATLPPPARWLAVTGSLWVELRKGARGFMVSYAGARHVIVIDGSTAEELLPSIICHELGHAFTFAPPGEIAVERAHLREPPLMLAERDLHARELVVGRELGEDLDATIRRLDAVERIADDLAALWGHPCHDVVTAAQRGRILREQLCAASERADEIEADIDRDVATFAARHFPEEKAA